VEQALMAYSRIKVAPVIDKLPFEVIGTTYRAIRLACPEVVEVSDEVVAYLCGIELGRHRIDGRFDAGDVIEFPIEYLPWVELPAQIHLVATETGSDICEPIPLSSHDQAVALVGLGETKVGNLVIEQGLLRGVAINRTNGLLQPQMFARINGVLPRPISIDPPRLLDDGGAQFRFAAQLHPTDLIENGMTVDVFLIGIDTPLASIAFRRADIDDMARRVVELEAQLEQVKTTAAFRISSLNSDIAARLDAMQQRIDTFIEYAGSFIFDRIAAAHVPTQAGVEPLSAGQRQKVDTFLALVRGPAEAGDKLPEQRGAAPRTDSVSVSPQSLSFSYGWYDVEEADGRQFRWMGGDALIANPHPTLQVRAVTIDVHAVFGAEQPMIRAAFDTRPARVTVGKAASGTGRGWQIKLTPPRQQKSTECMAINLASLVSASPVQARTGHDNRILSIAVTGVTFHYAEAD
jgi:hypothetical protein